MSWSCYCSMGVDGGVLHGTDVQMFHGYDVNRVNRGMRGVQCVEACIYLW